MRSTPQREDLHAPTAPSVSAHAECRSEAPPLPACAWARGPPRPWPPPQAIATPAAPSAAAAAPAARRATAKPSTSATTTAHASTLRRTPC